MRGPQHYQLAERLAVSANGMELQQAAVQVAIAQVHATLALAAATALAAPSSLSVREWRGVLDLDATPRVPATEEA